ncbi:MAG TPA: serine/threonine-protein kinase [Rhodothermales bacterium]|nr:serine/threonine-protein kinase [Rhodothermales bacterium]
MIGTVVSHYEILEQLGGGGMGVVYTARDTKLGRLVALKFLPPELGRDADANARFMQEAKAASGLDHPNICTIYEVGEAEDGRLFIAMAHYAGQTLKYRLSDGAIEEPEALDIARQIAEGLRAAHKKGIVHRDIKPANIMVLDDGLVKILDFGLAKLPGVLSLTQAGSTIGTAGYMSPEQIRGEEVDGRTDLWSLGVVLFQMITGRRPFEGDYEQALTYAILNQEAEIPGDVTPETGDILRRLLEKDLRNRYASAEELLADLPAPGSSGSHPAERAGPEPLIGRPLAIGAGLILLVALLASVYFNFFRYEATETGLDEMTIAVMPFTIRGQESLHYLGEGIVDLLSVKLDGAGEIRALDPNALLGVIAKDQLRIVTPEDAIQLANRLGAARVIVGSATQVGAEIQLTASLYGSGAESKVDGSVTAADESDVSAALDRLARQLIAGVLSAPDQSEVPLAAVTTSSFPALKAYLSGLQLSRSGHWLEATVQLEEAVQIDSSFALAWSALAWAYGWLPDPRETVALEHAWANSQGLPWRAKTLIEAANHGHRLGDGEKAINLYRAVLADYPNDANALRGMGEVVYHYNPLLGRPHSEADTYFIRASALAPDNVDFLIHQLNSATDEWDFARTDSLSGRLLELTDRKDIAEYSGHMTGVANRARGDSSWSISGPGSMNTHFVRTLSNEAAANFEDLDAAQQVVAMMVESDRYPSEDRNRAIFMSSVISAGQGRLRETLRRQDEAGPIHTGKSVVARSVYYGLPVYPATEAFIRSIRSDLAAWDTTASPVYDIESQDVHRGDYRYVKTYLDALLALRLDDLDAVARHKDFLKARADSSSGTDLAHSLLRSIDAVELLSQGRYSEAIQAVEDARLRINWRHAGKSPLFDQFANRFIQAEALRASGRLEEAIRVYRSLTAADHVAGVVLIGPQYLGVADAYEQLGNTEKAIEFYARLVRMWKDCDPELVPVREEAQRNVDRLMRESVKEPT